MSRSRLKDALKTGEVSSRDRWLQVITASIVFIIANFVDYTFTLYGIANTNYNEGNPIAKGYMDIFGLRDGLLLYKVLMVGMIILAVMAIDLVFRRDGIKYRPEYILYGGALLTALGGGLWLTI